MMVMYGYEDVDMAMMKRRTQNRHIHTIASWDSA